MKHETFNVLRRGFLVWLAIIAAEFVHGAARVAFLQPATGDFRARQITVFSGILLILTISYVFTDYIGAANRRLLLAVGFLWLGLTLAFEISLGRLLGYSWERIFSDYNLAGGGLLSIGLLFLTLSPLIAAKLKRNKLSATH